MGLAAHNPSNRPPGVAARAARGDRDRRDIVSGQVLPEQRLVRFVAAPDGQVVPDVAARLPGRGLWVEACAAAVNKAVDRKLFSRAAKQQVLATADLAARTENALVQRMLGDLGLARRAAGLILGFDSVQRHLDDGRAIGVLIAACDGAADGRRKLLAAARRHHHAVAVVDCLSSAELGLALGRENVIHAAILPGGLAERLIFDAERLKGFRSQNPASNPARTERDS